jgi:hypothetical protein
MRARAAMDCRNQVVSVPIAQARAGALGPSGSRSPLEPFHAPAPPGIGRLTNRQDV